MSLVLSRNIAQSIMIGDNVKITILGCRGNQVRLACEAPPDVEINRLEIWERKRMEKSYPADR